VEPSKALHTGIIMVCSWMWFGLVIFKIDLVAAFQFARIVFELKDVFLKDCSLIFSSYPRINKDFVQMNKNFQVPFPLMLPISPQLIFAGKGHQRQIPGISIRHTQRIN